MPIGVNYGPSNALVYGTNMQSAQAEENARRLAEYQELLAQLRAQNMDYEMSQQRLALDQEQAARQASQFDQEYELSKQQQDWNQEYQEKNQKFQQTPTFSINYTPSSHPTLSDRNQQMASWRQR